METEIDGEVFVTKTRTRVCEGCVGLDKDSLCFQLPDECLTKRVIWVKKEEAK